MKKNKVIKNHKEFKNIKVGLFNMKLDFQKKVLKNGMTVILEKRNLPIVSVAFALKQGGMNEESEEKGISHFIEHMLYKGTTNRTFKQISDEIEKNGGVLNGFTSETITAYWCKMPSEHLNIALNVLSDLVKNPLFEQKEIDKERQVIFEEMKMVRDTPRAYVFRKINELLYEEPFGSFLIGDEKTLGKMDKSILRKKFDEVYAPNNMILCVVGDANFEELVKFAENNFDNKVGILKEIKIIPKNESLVEERKGIDQANLVFSFHVPFLGDPLSYSARVLGVLMGGGMSSRLFSEIREKRNLAYSIKGDCDISSKHGCLLISVGTTKGNVEQVKNLVLEEFEKVSKNLTLEELNEVKKQMIGNYKIGMEDSQEQLGNLLYSEVEGGVEDYYKFEEKINHVQLEDVKKLAKIKDYSFFALVPE